MVVILGVVFAIMCRICEIRKLVNFQSPPLDAEMLQNSRTHVLLGQVYEYQNHGLVLIGGDFNGRCDLSEYIDGVHDIPDRGVIDSVESGQGNGLVEFIISGNLCMLNGRLWTNNFTCISHKGRSVVDFCFVPYKQFRFHHNDRCRRAIQSLSTRSPAGSFTATIVLSKWADIPTPHEQSVELQSEPNSDADPGPSCVVKDLPQS